jgi:conjugal transfer pilus assembly protein TraK
MILCKRMLYGYGWRMVFVAVAMIVALPGWAAEPIVRHVSDHQTVTVPLSSQDINHLSVPNDRIVEVVCPNGFCLSTHFDDDPYGSSLLGLAVDVPFTFYVTTEQGHQFGVLVTPRQQPGVTVQFVVDSVVKQVLPERWTALPYTEQIVAIMRAMIRWPDHDDSQFTIAPVAALPTDNRRPVRRIEAKPSSRHWVRHGTGQHAYYQALTMTPLRIVYADTLQGITYRLTNHSDDSITLTEQPFYQPGIRAVSLADTVVPAGHSVLIYQVLGQGSHG